MSTEESRHENSFGQLAGAIPSAVTWNDRDAECEKAFCTPESARDYLYRQTTLGWQFWEVIELARKHGLRLRGRGVDVGAGVCWATAWLSQFLEVTHIRAVDISEHRLKEFAPPILNAFDAQWNKITLAVEDFTRVKEPDGSMDFVFMGQALHHADHPVTLLRETSRILKPKGFVLIIGEEPVQPIDIAKRRLKLLFTNPRRALGSFDELFPPDEWGDHYYRRSDYRRLFRRSTMQWDHRWIGRFCIFVLWK